MKKTYLMMTLGTAMIAAAGFNFTMDIDSKGHYFGNGIVCGIGLSVLMMQFMKMRKQKGAKY